MKKIALVACLFLPLAAAAQTVTSPNGNVVVKFSLDGSRPQYEMTYKGKAVVKPSHLGLELAKDKHASKGMKETNLLDGFTIADTKSSTFDETWKNHGSSWRRFRCFINCQVIHLAGCSDGFNPPEYKPYLFNLLLIHFHQSLANTL